MNREILTRFTVLIAVLVSSIKRSFDADLTIIKIKFAYRTEAADSKLQHDQIAEIERIVVESGGGLGSGIPFWSYYPFGPPFSPPDRFKEPSIFDKPDPYPIPDPLIDPNRPAPPVPPAPLPPIKDKMSWSDWKKLQGGGK